MAAIRGLVPGLARVGLTLGPRWKLGTLDSETDVSAPETEWCAGVCPPASWLLISGTGEMQPKAQYNKPVYNSLEAVQKKLLEISLYHSMLKEITNFDHKTQNVLFSSRSIKQLERLLIFLLALFYIIISLFTRDLNIPALFLYLSEFSEGCKSNKYRWCCAFKSLIIFFWPKKRS